MTHKKEAEKLLRLAERDLKAFQVLISNSEEALIPAAYFHGQQLIEKCVKSVLAFHNVVYPFTHDLFELIGILMQNKISLSKELHNSTKMTPYAVRFRYDNIESDLIEPEEATRIVNDVLSWAQGVIGS